MKNILIIIVLFFYSKSHFAQCDSVHVTFIYTTGDCGDYVSKTVKHFSQTGKLLYKESYINDYPDYVWKPSSREYCIYDGNDSLINHSFQIQNGSGWIDYNRTLYSYNSFGSITSSTQQNFISNSWQTISADTNIYNAQNDLLSTAYYAPGPVTKNIFIYNASDSTLIIQHGDSFGLWVNISKHEKYFNGSQLTQEINSQWINNAWSASGKTNYYYSGNLLDSVSTYAWTNNSWVSTSRILYSYAGGFADSIITQEMDTVWKNQSLIVNVYSGTNLVQVYELHWSDTAWVNVALTTHDYDANGRIIRNYDQTWQDTIWINVNSTMYDYGPLNKVIHTYFLTGNDTGWVFETHIINEVDQNGYPTYEDELYAYYNGSVVGWESMYGPSYTTYSPDGLLLSRHGHHTPGGPYYSNYSYLNGALVQGHSYSETMGGLTCIKDIYGYFADVNGDSIICAGTMTTLYTDSCPSYQYLWSTGATTSSIQVGTDGNYFVTVTHPGGVNYTSRATGVKIVSQLPYMPTGPDSSILVCGNSVLRFDLPQQNNIIYQWYRNDSALNNFIRPEANFYGSFLANGEYYLTATNACGTDTSASTFVQLIPYPPNPTITPNGNLNICSGDTLLLTSSPGNSYEWNPGGQTTQSVSIYNSGNYNVRVFDIAGCGSNSVSVHVTKSNNSAIPTILFQNGTLQAGYSGTYQWFLNGDTIVGANQPVYTPVISGNYSLAVADYIYCVKFTNTIYLNLNVVNVSIPPIVHICPGGGVQLGGYNPVIGGTPPYLYSWSTDNQNFIPGNSNFIVSNLTNDQTYYLKVFDSLGSIAVDSVHVIVVQTVKPLLSNENNCSGIYNPLRVSNYTGTSYNVSKWVVNGDTVNSSNSALLLYSSGIYQVQIRDQNYCQVWSDPDTIYLFTRPLPPLINATLDSNACINGSGSLWVNSTPGFSYKWYQYSNILLDTDTVLQVNFPVFYKLEVTDSNSCSNSSFFDFNLFDENIEMVIVSDHFPMCEIDTVHLRASVINGWTYEWFDSNNNLLDTGTVLSVIIPDAYTCIATSPSGCTASASTYVSQYTSPAVIIIDSAGILVAPSGLYTSYQWYRNGQQILGAMNHYYIPVNPGAYYVRMKNLGYGLSCYGYSNIIYFGTCTASVNNSITCSGQCQGQLNANGLGSGTLNYNWSNGSTLASINNLCAGTYIVTITDSIGCVAVDTAVVSDSINYSISHINPNCSGCTNGQITIQGSFLSISWQPNTGTLIGNTIINLSAGIYNVCVTDSNQCMRCVSDTLVDSPLEAGSISSVSLSYFPNPVSEKITVSGFITNESFDVLIYDKTGRLVDSFHTSSRIFDVSRYLPGIYTIAFRNTKNLFRLNFIKI